MTQPTLLAIYLTPQAGGALTAVQQARAIAGRGLEGDRYFLGAGSYSNLPGGGRQLTLIEAEALEALAAESGVQLTPAEARRNLLTRGVALNDLVGQEFTVGEVRLRGVRLCDPCDYLEGLTRPGVLRGLVERGGLRVDILSDGLLHVGDEIRLPDGG
jgi:MOSC domain-containing protein YiiM